MRKLWFITHPEVVIDPAKPVPKWSLSKTGLSRMGRFCSRSAIAQITSVYSSSETKAVEGASLLARALGLQTFVVAQLHENDRSSTGYLATAAFQKVATRFFAEPLVHVEGWERAVDAQSRIRQAIESIATSDQTQGDIAVVSHGGVGALLMCHLRKEPISPKHEQPGSGGGNFFLISLGTFELLSGWEDIAGE